MRIFIIIVVLLTQFKIFSQSEKFYKISGKIVEKKSKLIVPNCNILLTTNTGFVFSTMTDKYGIYNIDSIPIENYSISIRVHETMFYPEVIKFQFSSIPTDTTMNFEIDVISMCADYFPEIYFHENKIKSDSNFLFVIKWITDFLLENKDLNIVIIGFKDSSEIKDYRYERAFLVYNEIVKQGGDSNRLKIEVSNKPSKLKPDIIEYDYAKKKYNVDELTEEYILNSPIEKQESLRQLNKIVTFYIK
ncbi:MAG: hypothetical protein PHC83_06230 [Bacteroidales bacterium]|nr:hypothetical protein [Bacteroidales bacterium]MDD4209286.1 hypothetical protein [Bacteroidales bacterium]